MTDPKLRVSEWFYSLQGEGPYVGTPAVFLRLAGCNLTCSGYGYKDPETGEHLGCDTKAVWRKGQPMSMGDLIQTLAPFKPALTKGAHLVVTGGEPTLQQEALCQFLDAFAQKLGRTPFIELETNATQVISDRFLAHLAHINASPKLSCNGDPEEKRVSPEALTQLAGSEKTVFKFVVRVESDVQEANETLIIPYGISPQRVWLMPEAGTRDELIHRGAEVATWCKKWGYRFSTRMHLTLWDQATGV